MISREKEISPESKLGTTIEKVVFDKNIDLVFEINSAGHKVLAPVECYLRDKQGNKLFDFAELLPPDYKFVRFLSPEPMIWGHLSSGEKMIAVGELHNPKQVMSLLHEIGHSYQWDLILRRNQYLEQIKNLDLEKDRLIDEFNTAIDKKSIKDQIKQCENETKALKQEKLKLQAEIEKEVWEFVRQTIQKIRNERQIDVLKPFKNLKELDEFINSALDIYAVHVAREFGPEMARLFSTTEKSQKYLDLKKKYYKFRD